LTAHDAGTRVVLAGWILPYRKGKLVSFIPLKDSFGTTQLIINHSDGHDVQQALYDTPAESVVLIEGTVLLRPAGANRPGPTGDIDVQVDKFVLLNPADANLPFLPSNPRNLPGEDLRARYRYLDLRRSALSDNLRKRSQVAHIARTVLHEHDFLEVETPVLLRSSPEGAREFIVPTRTANPSDEPLFFALPQSPQQPKQLLICSGGVDRYYQLAKCFRDEDGRKDRQPEFTQIDLEMAFVSWGSPYISSSSPSSDIWRIGGGEVRDVIETLIRKIWQDIEGLDLSGQFPVMTYYDAMKRFGSDKPDTRFSLEISDMTHLLSSDHLACLEASQETLECIVVREHEFLNASRKCERDLPLERITVTDQNLSSWLTRSKTLGDSSLENQDIRINEALQLSPGNDVWLTRSPRYPTGASTPLGRLRLRLSELAQARGELTLPDKPHFLWITEFPLFTRADRDKEFLAHGRWSSSHHPFTAPMWQDIEAMYSGQVDRVRGQHYDLVLNGVEIGGGSVRVHDATMQNYIFTDILQLNEEERAPFSQLLHALQCGAPPHGGIALGFDRLMSILCKTQSIRDVIAFPKTSVGTDPLFKSPAPSSKAVLNQYGIQPCS